MTIIDLIGLLGLCGMAAALLGSGLCAIHSLIYRQRGKRKIYKEKEK